MEVLRMTNQHIVFGRIIPERKSFGHEGFRLYVKQPESGIDICVLIGAIDNQLVTKVIGDIGQQSNVYLKKVVSQAEDIILNGYAFITGSVFEVDVIVVIRDDDKRSDGSSNFHYLDNTHDVISDRQSTIDLNKIWMLCISDDGLALRRCLNDLRSALKFLDDSPFYCYRAIEIIKGHIGDRSAERNINRQWETMRAALGVSRNDIENVKSLADPLRHGRTVQLNGAEWRRIVEISWDIAEAYIQLLWRVKTGEQSWSDNPMEL